VERRACGALPRAARRGPRGKGASLPAAPAPAAWRYWPQSCARANWSYVLGALAPPLLKGGQHPFVFGYGWLSGKALTPQGRLTPDLSRLDVCFALLGRRSFPCPF